MNYKPLIEVVVQLVLFLELSNSVAIDEDTAVGLLEQIAGTLRQLGPAEKKQFIEYLQQQAKDAKSDKERECIMNMADNLGLTAK